MTIEQEEMDFVTSIQPTDGDEFTKEHIEDLVEEAAKHTAEFIIIDGEKFLKTPDPDRKRKLVPPDAPIVTYCSSEYYLINSAKLQSVRDLTLIVGILPSTGKQLLEKIKNNYEE